MKRSLFILLTALWCLPSFGQNHLVTHNFIRSKVAEGYFIQKAGTNIPTDDYCINKSDAMSWLYLIESYLPQETNRMPWWSELVPATRYDSCTYRYDVCYAPNPAYSSCGAYIYNAGFDVNLAYYNRDTLGASNPYWKSTPTGDPFTQCTVAPPKSSGVNPQARTAGKPDKDSISGTQMMLLNTTLDGPLNRCGVWPCGGNTGVWYEVSGTFVAPTEKTYYIGAAGDNAFRIYIDGELFVSYDNGDDYFAWRVWHIFPVTLTAGAHSIVVQGKDLAGDRGFGCEVYDNTKEQLANAVNSSSLNILFTTAGRTTVCGPLSLDVSLYIDDQYNGICIDYMDGLNGYGVDPGNPVCAYAFGKFYGYTGDYITLLVSSPTFKTLYFTVDWVQYGSYPIYPWASPMLIQIPTYLAPAGNILIEIY